MCRVWTQSVEVVKIQPGPNWMTDLTMQNFFVDLPYFLPWTCSTIRSNGNSPQNVSGGSRRLVCNMLSFLRFLEVLEGLERSGRLVGWISCKFSRNSTWWRRVMTKNVKRLTTNEQQLFQCERRRPSQPPTGPKHQGGCVSTLWIRCFRNRECAYLLVKWCQDLLICRAEGPAAHDTYFV